MNKEKRITLSSINGIGLVPLALLAVMAIPAASFAQTKVDETVLKNLQWRSIGPAIMGGRIDDIAVVESNPSIFYVGAATGGVVGGLIGLGIPEIEAKRYDEKLRKGNYLIAVHTDESKDVNRAKHIFKTAGAEDISTVSETSPAKV